MAVTEKELDYRDILLKFIASLTLCEHMGDVADDIETVLGCLGIELEWEDLDDLRKQLHKMSITTLYGTPLVYEDDEDEDE